MSNSLNPQVPKGQFALIQVEVRTGILLGLDGKRFTGQGERFLFFENLASATEKSKEIVRSNPEIECCIHNDSNQQVGMIRDENYLKTILETARKIREQKHQ
jgi:hypothetical protein